MLVQAQAISASAASTGRAANTHALRPTFRLPLNGECSQHGLRELDPQQHCFIPLTAITEDLEHLRLAVATTSDAEHGPADEYIELRGSAMQEAQGVHRCNAAVDTYLSLKVEQQPVQVRATTCAEESGFARAKTWWVAEVIVEQDCPLEATTPCVYITVRSRPYECLPLCRH